MKENYVYTLNLNWTGNTGNGTQKFNNYQRTFEAKIEGKPILKGSADEVFHGNSNVYNPEDLLLTAISSCFMLSFFYLCAKNNVIVTSYTDTPKGYLKLNSNGSGQFEKVILSPIIQLKNSQQQNVASQLFHQAQELCFIARSCNFPIEHTINFK